MTTELVFTVNGAKAEPARPISLAEAGLRERRDLQEWVIAHPQILGPDVKVVGFEFNQWQSYDGSRELDRLDVLGIDDVEELTVSPTRTGGQSTTGVTRSKREGSSVVKLIRAGEIDDDTVLTLQPVGVNQEVREAIDHWVAADPKRGRAVWHNDRRAPLEWEVDGSRWRPTPLAQRILAEVGVEQSVRGPAWWALPDGRDLATAAGDASRASAFDWTALHELLEAIPSERWTTYGDLAKVIGTAAHPLGQHISKCLDCPNAQRVLGADGRPRPGFAWGDPADDRTQEEALITDGVRMINDAAQRLDTRELAGLRQVAQ